jgi:ABC-type dipeptide/oligopeptide/nickel transport system permease component
VEARSVIADRIAAAFVLAVLAVACLVFWIGIPLAVLWGLSKATDDATTHFVSGLLGVPLAMALFSPLLFWLNNLYLRVTGVLDRLAEDEEESGWQRRVRGPLEPMLFLSLAVAIVALCIWFFFIAEDPPRQII